MVPLTNGTESPGTERPGAGGHIGGQVVAEQERIQSAAHKARSVAEQLSAVAPPRTPHVELPLLPALGQFLAALQQARARHHEATGELARFYQGAAGALDEFRGRVDEHEQATQAGFEALAGGVR
ncbi:hypothetical protein [Corynebacterium sp.]|uniref:hypothetical protein n=1 Tax=Corynebacterium sp. TaxID=1720 RepID=UPI00261C0F66|nr:hypothetical protein [Corynebacterium sp.]